MASLGETALKTRVGLTHTSSRRWYSQETKRSPRHWRDAGWLLEIFKRGGNLEGTTPAFAVVSIAISACGRARRWTVALELLEASRSVVQPDPMMCTSLIGACRHASAWWQAIALLSDMERQELRSRYPEPGIVHYSAAMAACEVGGQWKAALALFASAERRGLNANVKCYGAAVSVCGKGNRWEHALRLVSRMHEQAVEPDEIVYNAAISACGKARKLGQSLALWDEMRKLGIQPTVPTISALVNACDRQRNWELAVEIFGGMQQYRVDADSVTLNTTISACESGMQWERAFHLLDHATTGRTLKPSLEGFNSAISACSKCSEWERSVQILDAMLAQPDIQPSVVCFNSVLLHCSGQQWHVAVRLLACMRNQANVDPDMAGVRGAAEACETAGQADVLSKLVSESAKLLSKMESNAAVRGKREEDITEASQVVAVLRARGLVSDKISRAWGRRLEVPLAAALTQLRGDRSSTGAFCDQRGSRLTDARIHDDALEAGSAISIDFVRVGLTEGSAVACRLGPGTLDRIRLASAT